MVKSYLCPESGTDDKPMLALFLRCYDMAHNSVDASTAISLWRQDNYIRVTEKDFIQTAKAGIGEAFKLFIEILSETFGESHITAPSKYKTGFINQSRMLCARKNQRQTKPRCFAFNRKDNQLTYIGIR